MRLRTVRDLQLLWHWQWIWTWLLTVNAECNRCLVLLSFLHGTVENDATITRAIIVFCRCNGQCACRLVILWTATIYDRLQRCRAAVTIPSSEIDCDNDDKSKNVNSWLTWTSPSREQNVFGWIEKITYVIVGSGEPPTLLHVNSCFFSSVATTTLPGATSGGCGGVRTVKL